jgi:hypothetical protein
VVANNTIVEPRIAAIRINAGSINNVIFNNIATGRVNPIADEDGSNYIDENSNLTQIATTGLFVDDTAGDYHLADTSPAIDGGVSSYQGRSAPNTDIEGSNRPEGGRYDIGAYECASGALGTIFSDIPSLGDISNWSPLTSGYWEVSIDPNSGDRTYVLNDTARSDLEYSLFEGGTYGDFALTLRARTAEPASNAWRDYIVIFGFQDADNYYYVFFNASDNDTTNGIMKRENGNIAKISELALPPTIVDDLWHNVEITRVGSDITVKIDGITAFAAIDSTFDVGKIGLGSYNDSAYFDDVNVVPIETLSQPGKPIHVDS